jgi:hypothetical protein
MLHTGQDGLMRSLSYAGLIEDSAGDPFSSARSGKSHRVHKRTSELFRDLAVVHTDGSIGRFLVRLSCIDILLLDDFAMAPLKDAERRDFLEICDDRYQRRSMILTSQMPSARLRLRMWMIFRHDYKGQRRELRRLIQSSEYAPCARACPDNLQAAGAEPLSIPLSCQARALGTRKTRDGDRAHDRAGR